MFNGLLIFLPSFTILFACILAEELSEKTIKNVLPYNISKFKFFFGKFFVQIIFLIFTYLIFLLGFILSLKLCSENDISIWNDVMVTCKMFFAAIPSYISSLALINLLIVIFKKDTLVYMIYLTFFLPFPLLITALSTYLPSWFENIQKYIFLMGISQLSSSAITQSSLTFAIINGLAYTFIFSLVAYLIFSKQEIK